MQMKHLPEILSAISIVLNLTVGIFVGNTNTEIKYLRRDIDELKKSLYSRTSYETTSQENVSHKRSSCVIQEIKKPVGVPNGLSLRGIISTYSGFDVGCFSSSASSSSPAFNASLTVSKSFAAWLPGGR